MNVSDATKRAYKSDTAHKNLTISIPSLNKTIGNSQIWSESMVLKENIMSGSNFEFVGCVSSQFSVTVSGISDNIVGKYIEVSISTDDTDAIPLFKGYVTDCEKQTNRTFKKITAYDILSKKGKKNIIDWWNTLTFPITCANLRNQLFQKLEITQVSCSLPNDSVSIQSYTPSQLSALDLIKAICQMNGVCGIINRDGEFEYRGLNVEPVVASYGAFPKILIPKGDHSFPGYVKTLNSVETYSLDDSGDEPQTEQLGYYRKVDYSDYTVKPITKITIRKNGSDVGVSYGDGDNNYVLQANILLNNQESSALQTIAQKIYNNVKDISFIPFTSENNGLPYMEVGKDTVNLYVLNDEGTEYEMKTFSVMGRELKGIQSLKDNFSAEAEEVQQEFPTDSYTQTESIVSTVSVGVASEVEREFGLRVLSVAAMPANPKANTIYLIQGDVVVN